jgi:phosphoglycerate dehydrogenase-like enzyme
MPRVLIGPAHLADVEAEFRAVLRAAGFELAWPPRRAQMTEAELMGALQGCDAVLAGSEPYTRRVFTAHPQLRIVARCGVGYDAVDVGAATEAGIPVTVAPGNAAGVAEHAFALMLALAKAVIPQDADLRAGRWPRRSNLPLRGQLLGIIGLGRVGRAVALRAIAFRMRVVAFDPYVDPAFARAQAIEFVPRDELFRSSDFVSLHLPLNDETRYGITASDLRLMKPTAFLINTARGGVIVESDLLHALRDGRIAGAGLDVFDPEPPAETNALLKLPNVVLTAHTAGVDTRSRDDMALIAATAIVDYFRGEWPGELVVNPATRA